MIQRQDLRNMIIKTIYQSILKQTTRKGLLLGVEGKCSVLYFFVAVIGEGSEVTYAGCCTCVCFLTEFACLTYIYMSCALLQLPIH